MAEEREPVSFDAVNKVMAEIYRPLLEMQWTQMMKSNPFPYNSTEPSKAPPLPLTAGEVIEFLKKYDPSTIVGYNDYESGYTKAYSISLLDEYKMIVIE